MNLADRLRAFRRKCGLTQAEAASLLGVPLRTWQNWEISRNTPRGFALLALEKQLLQPKKPATAGKRPEPSEKKPKRRSKAVPRSVKSPSPPDDQQTLATHLL